MALLGLLRPAALTPLAGSAPPLAACLQRVAHRAFSMRGFDDRERGEEQVRACRRAPRALGLPGSESAKSPLLTIPAQTYWDPSSRGLFVRVRLLC